MRAYWRARAPLARTQIGHDRKEQPASRLPDLHPVERLEGGKVHATQRPLAELGGDGWRDCDGTVAKA
jgi:hypothetical protein